MEKKKTLIVLNITLLVIAFALQLFVLLKGSSSNGFTVGVVNALAIISGIAYVIMDYKKEAAVWYKVFSVCLTAAVILNAPSVIMNEGKGILAVADMVLVGCLFVLVFAQNLKREKSIAFGFIAFAMSVIHLVMLIGLVNSVVFCISYVNILILILVMNIMVNGKYIDKKERGREL